MSIRHPQLLDVDHQLQATLERARALAERAGPGLWQRQPAPGRWAPSECVQHLITTVDAFLPRVDEVFDAAPVPEPPVMRAFTPGLLGRVLLWVTEPPYRLRTKTSAPFVPPSTRTPEVDLTDLASRHAGLRERLIRADGHPLDRLTIVSPFDARVRYSLFTTFRLLPTHERRHLWQAERTVDELEQTST